MCWIENETVHNTLLLLCMVIHYLYLRANIFLNKTELDAEETNNMLLEKRYLS